MPIPSKKKDNGVYLGAYIPPEYSNFLSLYCDANGISKTSVVNDLLNSWKQKEDTEKAKRALVARAAKRVHAVWVDSLGKHKKGRKKYRDFDDFCERTELSLINEGKGMSHEDAASVLKLVRKRSNGNEKD